MTIGLPRVGPGQDFPVPEMACQIQTFPSHIKSTLILQHTSCLLSLLLLPPLQHYPDFKRKRSMEWKRMSRGGKISGLQHQSITPPHTHFFCCVPNFLFEFREWEEVTLAGAPANELSQATVSDSLTDGPALLL